MKKLKKLLAWMLMLVLAVGVINITSFDVKAADPGEIEFDISDGGTVEYSVDGSVWNTVTNGDKIVRNSDTNIYLKATPAQGKKLDDYLGQQLIRYDQTDFNIDLDDLKDGKYNFSYVTTKSYNVKIRFVEDNGGGGNSNVTPGKYNVDISISDAIKNSFSPNIKIQFTDDSGNVKETINPTANVSETAIPSGTTKAVITMAGDKLQNARLRDSASGEDDLIDDIRRNGSKTCTIDISRGYSFVFEFSNEMNVSWSYDPSKAAQDQLVEHARIELLNSDNPADYKDYGRTDWNLTIGEDYYFVLIPDYGYQIVGLNINGYKVEPQNSVGVFKFTMQASNFHFQGIVEPANDIIEYQGEMLGDAMLSNGSNATANGNVKLSVSDSEQDWNAFSILDDGYSMFGTVDMTIDQVISKGNGDYWKTPISETSAPVEVSIIVPAGELLEGETYSVVREHEGIYEEIKATYDAAAELLTFDTDKFSKYTILKKSDGNNGNGGKPDPDPDPSPEPDPDPEIPVKTDYLDNLYNSLNNLKNSGFTGTYVWTEGTSLPIDVIRMMRTADFTLEFRYTYEGIDYVVRINKYNAPKEYISWYGPLYLAGLNSNNGLSSGNVYTVVEGDTLSMIASRFNTTLEDILAKNPQITNADYIYVGQKIVL